MKLAILNSVIFLFVATTLTALQLTEDKQLIASFSNAQFFGKYGYLPWYMWVAIATFLFTFVIYLIEKLRSTDNNDTL